MSRIRGKDTGPERAMACAFAAVGLEWEEQARDLPGRPDFVFRAERVAVFVDGDFWHGWRFPQWKDKLSEQWERKISDNRRRDVRNHKRLRREGWVVVRFWEHQIEKDAQFCARKVAGILADSRGKANEVSGRV